MRFEEEKTLNRTLIKESFSPQTADSEGIKNIIVLQPYRQVSRADRQPLDRKKQDYASTLAVILLAETETVDSKEIKDTIVLQPRQQVVEEAEAVRQPLYEKEVNKTTPLAETVNPSRRRRLLD